MVELPHPHTKTTQCPHWALEKIKIKTEINLKNLCWPNKGISTKGSMDVDGEDDLTHKNYEENANCSFWEPDEM